MHAPSPSLLRAMRFITSSSSSAAQARTIRERCLSQQIAKATPTLLPHTVQYRTLSTTSRLPYKQQPVSTETTTTVSTSSPQKSSLSSPPPSTSSQPQTPQLLPTHARSQKINRHAPTHRDRGPVSQEDTQTDFGKMDILGNMGQPATYIDACVGDGFHLNNGLKTGGGAGVLLLGGEAFEWSPWKHSNPDSRIGELLDAKRGLLKIPPLGFGVLELLYPKPDLLLIGTGMRLWMLDKETRQYLGGLGVRVDFMDTQNAAAAYNLLATERGVEGVGAALLPVGWRGNV